MFDEFTQLLQSAGPGESLTPQEMLIRLLAGVLIGLWVGGTYYFAQPRALPAAWPFITTLVLLTILVGITTLVIGNSTARAFSLVGALSIVRFRTVVEDSRDTAFVIFAVIIGMGVGAGNLQVCLLGVPITSATAILLHLAGRGLGARQQHLLEIRLGMGLDSEAILRPILTQYLSTVQLVAATTARQGAALEVKYRVQMRDPRSPLLLVRDLNRTEGVQQVELREG